jgi:hypothetical protein
MVRLVNDGRSGLSGRLLRLKLNDTEPDTGPQITDQNGNATWTKELSPKTDNSATIYNIVVSFEGDTAKTATAYLTSPNGIRYAVCTTIQYNIGTATGYKPSTNGTSVIIYPQTTTGATVLKSPEQMQKDAEANGGLRPEARFSWAPPFFSLHYIMAFDEEDMLDVGLGLIGMDSITGVDRFWLWLNDFISIFAKPVAWSYIFTDIAVYAAMNGGPQTFIIALIVSIIAKMILLWPNWSSAEGMKSAFIGAWVSLILGIVGCIKMLHSELVSLAYGVLTAVDAATFWKFLYKFVYIPINLAFLLLITNQLRVLGGI